MRRDFDTTQFPALRTFLSTLKPREELAYRLALRGLFWRCGQDEWKERIDELMDKVVKGNTETLARVLKRAREIAEKMKVD